MSSSLQLQPGLRERKKASQRESIQQAGLDLFRKHGYEATTVDDIARAANISQPTFYKYFPAKDALLRDFVLTASTQALEALVAMPGSVELRLRQFFRGLGTYMTAERKLWYAIATSNAYNPVRDPEVLHDPAAATRTLERLIAQGHKSGELTRTLSAVRLASALEGLMLRTCLEWGANFPKPHNLSTALDQTLTFYMRAARA